MKFLSTTQRDAREIERALFARHCRALDVDPEAVRAGTATLDRDARTGEPVFPPITTTGAHVDYDGEQALVLIEPHAEALDGQRVEGKRLDFAASVERDALPEKWRPGLSSTAEESRRP